MEEKSNIDWVSYHVYCFGPLNQFLLEYCEPLIEKLLNRELISCYFFIRYWERGPHIRLRFKPVVSGSQASIQAIIEEFATEISLSIDKNIYSHSEISDGLMSDRFVLKHNYIPEIDRYGGLLGIELAEQHFYHTSKMVITALKSINYQSYETILGMAMQLHVGFIYATGMSIGESTTLYKKVFQEWLPLAYGESLDRQKENSNVLSSENFDQVFEKQKKMLLERVEHIWHSLISGQTYEQTWYNEWINETKIVCKSLRKLDLQKKLYSSNTSNEEVMDISYVNVTYVYNSYIHMLNNRLGVNNRDESYIAYILMRCFDKLQTHSSQTDLA